VIDLYDAFTKSAQRPTILCDVDNTLAWTMNQVLGMLNARFDTNVRLADVTVYHFEANLPIDQSTWVKMQLSKAITYANIAPDFHAIDSINALHSRGYNVVIGTSRATTMKSVTAAWLEEWGVQYDDLVVGPTAKIDFAMSTSNIIAIDDDPASALKLAEHGAQVWIPDRTYTPAWCKSSKITNVQVFSDWDALLTNLT